MFKYLGSVFTILLAVGVFGCASNNVNEGSCERIVEACHPKDTGSGAPHDCHEFAEGADVTDDACAVKEDDCLTACQ
jgi:hypothetical protein